MCSAINVINFENIDTDIPDQFKPKLLKILNDSLLICLMNMRANKKVTKRKTDFFSVYF